MHVAIKQVVSFKCVALYEYTGLTMFASISWSFMPENRRSFVGVRILSEKVNGAMETSETAIASSRRIMVYSQSPPIIEGGRWSSCPAVAYLFWGYVGKSCRIHTSRFE